MPTTKLRLQPRLVAVLMASLLAASVLTAVPASALIVAAPEIVGPTTGQTSGNPTFEWKPVVGAVSYLVWIDVPLSTGNPPITTVNTMLTDILFQASTHVDWAVAAVDADGTESPRSEASFEVGPLVPSLLAPADSTSFIFPVDSPYLAWQPAYDGGAASFYVDDRANDGSLPDLAGLAVYRAELGGAPGHFRWTAGQGNTPPLGTAPIRSCTVAWPESVPDLVAPADGADAGRVAPVLSWTRVDGASGYDVQVDDDAAFGSPISITNVMGLATPVSLAAGTWTWRVRAREPQGGTGAWSATRTLVVAEVATPDAASPSDGADLAEYPLLRWQPVAGADGYQLQVTPSIGDPNIQTVRVPGTAFTAEPPGWQTFAPIVFGPDALTLSWRVRATFPANGYPHDGVSAWSPWRAFTVDPPNDGNLDGPIEATLVAPTGCADVETCAAQPWSPVLDWDPVAGAAFYRVFMEHGGDGAGPAFSFYDTAGSTFVDRFPSSTESVVGWGVVACPSLDDCPSSLDVLPGRYRVVTPAPALAGPEDGFHSVDPSVVVSWTAAPVDPAVPSSPITYYAVELQEVVNGEWSAWASDGVLGTQSAYRPPTTHVGDQWRWRIRALPAAGPASAWSTWRAFDRPPLLPTITAPADGATTDTTPRLTWESVPSTSTGYHVDLVRGTPGGGNWAGFARWQFDVAGRSLDVQPNLPPGDYTWRVSAGDPGGLADLAPLSSIGHFNVAATPPPVLLAPLAGASVPDDQGVFTWLPVDGAVTYRVDLATDPDFATEHLIDSGDAWSARWATRLRLPAGAIYWRVTAFAPGYNVIGSAQADFAIGVSQVRMAIAGATTPGGAGDTFGPQARLGGPASPTKATSLSYEIVFDEPAAGLSSSDFTVSGTATGCSVGSPMGGPTTYSVTLSACAQGTVTLTLKPGAVEDEVANGGPAAPVSASPVLIDRTAPVASAPTVTLRAGSAMTGTRLPITVRWVASDAGGAGIATYTLDRSTDGGSTWTAVSSSFTGTILATTAATTGTVRFRVRATDMAGNVGPSAAGPVLSPRRFEEGSASITRSGTWSKFTSAVYSGGAVRATGRAGRSATFRFTGRAVAFVTTKSPRRGYARIYVDGKLVTTVNLHATTSTYRYLAWQRRWAASGTHKIRVVVVGTTSHPRVDLDAFAVIR